MPNATRLDAARSPRAPGMIQHRPATLWPAVLVVLLGVLVLLFELTGATRLLPGLTGTAAGRPPALEASPAPNSGPATPAQVAATPPPEPEPLVFKEMTAEQAKVFNATVGEAALPNPAARRFLLPRADALAFNRAADCLAAAVYYEAGFESAAGQRAVAQVVLNRVRHPAYPSTVCGVVFQGQERATGCQFTFTCDGALAHRPAPARWAAARQVALAALGGYVHAPVGWATHYHADYVVPYWAPSLIKAETVGAHIFYRWKGGWGRPYAFSKGWGRLEPEIAKLAPLSPAHRSTLGTETLAAAGVEGLPPELQALVVPSQGGEGSQPEVNAAEGEAGEQTKAERAAAVRFRLSVKSPAPTPKPVQIADSSGRVSSDALKWAITGAAQSEPALGRKSAERCRVVAAPSAEPGARATSTVRCETVPAAAGQP